MFTGRWRSRIPASLLLPTVLLMRSRQRCIRGVTAVEASGCRSRSRDREMFGLMWRPPYTPPTLRLVWLDYLRLVSTASPPERWGTPGPAAVCPPSSWGSDWPRDPAGRTPSPGWRDGPLCAGVTHRKHSCLHKHLERKRIVTGYTAEHCVPSS